MSHYFNQAKNFTINGLSQTDVHVDFEQQKENAFQILQGEMIPGASHNSKERYDAPKCHPETRKAVLRNIKSWIDSNNKSTSILWLNGPAGAGKSAIVQTTAIDSHSKGKLVASFFFSRYSSSRSKKDGLVATIAYQMCISIPDAKDYIIESIAKNPNIFHLDIKTQVQSLVVEPISRVNQDNMDTLGRFPGPRLVVIDGLDECVVRKDQAEIIEALASTLTLNTGHGLRVLLASRPELKIRRAFRKDQIFALFAQLILDDTYNPDKDIDLYLRSHFEALKHQNEMGTRLPAFWPSNNTINLLVKNSSSQFIYASTVMKYIADPRRDPKKQLDNILNIIPRNDDKPFAQLDALYSSVLLACEDYEKVSSIFAAIMFLNDRDRYDRNLLCSVKKLDSFLALKEDIMLLLADLHSIVDVHDIRRRGLRFYHASMYDYLTDSRRSGQFCINRSEAHALLSIHCLDSLVNHRVGDHDYTVFFYSYANWRHHHIESNLDERVSHHIIEKGIIKPDNMQIGQVLLDYRSHERVPARSTSMLGEWITDFGNPKRKRTLPDIIVAEFINQLKLFPRQERIAILYQIYSLTPSVLGFRLIDASFNEPSYPTGATNILSHDIYEKETLQWFINLIKTTGYINKLPDDIRTKAILSLMDMSWEKRRDCSYGGLALMEDIFDNIPLSSGMVSTVLSKWETVKAKHAPVNHYTHWTDEYIRMNCQRALQLVGELGKNVSSKKSPMKRERKSPVFAVDVPSRREAKKKKISATSSVTETLRAQIHQHEHIAVPTHSNVEPRRKLRNKKEGRLTALPRATDATKSSSITTPNLNARDSEIAAKGPENDIPTFATDFVDTAGRINNQLSSESGALVEETFNAPSRRTTRKKKDNEAFSPRAAVTIQTVKEIPQLSSTTVSDHSNAPRIETRKKDFRGGLSAVVKKLFRWRR